MQNRSAHNTYRQGNSGPIFQRRNQSSAFLQTSLPPKIIVNDSLIATEEEKHATSASLYGDSKARISSNINILYDKLRINQYKKLLPLCRGKRVLQLSCGIGLFAMMIAKHGQPKEMVAIDTSSVVDCCSVVAEQNGLVRPHYNLTFLKGSIQNPEVQALLPVKEFDIIFSEWMGAFLTNESTVLDDTLYCRDVLLANYGKNKKAENEEGRGLIIPNKSSISLVGINDNQYYTDTVEFWDNVYGFKMQAMKSLVYEEASASRIPNSQIYTNRSEPFIVDIFTTFLSTLDNEGKVVLNSHDVANNGRQYSFPFKIIANAHTTIQYLTFFIDASFFHSEVIDGSKRDFSFVLPGMPGSPHNARVEISVLLREFIPVNHGDVITGSVAITPLFRFGKLAGTVATKANNEMTKECADQEKALLSIASTTHAEVNVKARCEGSVMTVETGGKYIYTY